MTDKELLEYAARAAGIEYGGFDPRRGLLLYYDNITDNGHWNPLTDDGDALRLAVRLGLDINCYTKTNETSACLYDEGIKFRFIEKTSKDKYAATRRAIVRAAAEIGRGEK